MGSKEINLKEIINALEVQLESKGRMKVKGYTDIYYEWLKMLGAFGSVISLAFKDINDKAKQINSNQDFLKNLEPNQPFETIEETIDFEFDKGIYQLNGNLFKSTTKKTTDTSFLLKHKSEIYYFQSTSWVVIKGAWFYEFLTELFRQIADKQRPPMSECAKKAYDFGLKRHHPWILQKTVGLVMGQIVNRDKFEEEVIRQQKATQRNPNYSRQDLMTDLEYLSTLCKLTADYIWKVFDEKGVHDDIA